MHTTIAADLIENDILALGKYTLDILLKDRTMKRNIIWGTNDYVHLGDLYRAENEITLNSIIGSNTRIIQPRITKEQAKQNHRTHDKAEVFTPSWICNEQNNLIDEQWFGRKGVFNIELKKTWRINPKKITFPEIKGRSWQNYVEARRMEITCGEAPYLASRYDAVTGEVIDVKRRIGLLDRKLRVINENVDDKNNWFYWTERAYQSIYGYEYQGDNLLLARENLLFTFVDNMKYKFNYTPDSGELDRIAMIISWNIWQMDGITYTAPLSDVETWMQQLTFLDFIETEKKLRTFCKIKDWRSKLIVEYISLVKGQNNE